MGSRHRREQREASYRRHQEDVCARKVPYRSAQKAKNAIRNQVIIGKTLDFYCCPVCSKWHVTSHPQPKEAPSE